MGVAWYRRWSFILNEPFDTVRAHIFVLRHSQAVERIFNGVTVYVSTLGDATRSLAGIFTSQ